MIKQPVVNLVGLLAQKNIKYVVISPGSRSAPLTIAFARHPEIQKIVIPDERSAGFIALGLAQQIQAPVCLVCTSGTAAYNYAPAIAEAFYQEIPLLVITADRPPEWIDQQDGQTIRQDRLFQPHIKKSYQFPASFDHPDLEWYAYRMVNEAHSACLHPVAGPVHINLPLREPLYPADNEHFEYQPVKQITRAEVTNNLPEAEWQQLINEFSQLDKRLFIAGQLVFEKELEQGLSTLLDHYKIPVVCDIISNLHGLSQGIKHADILLSHQNQALKQELAPDLVITWGRSVISKNLKLFLRKYKPKAHWHVQAGLSVAADTFQSLTRVIPISPQAFFPELLRHLNKTDFSIEPEYLSKWKEAENKATSLLDQLDHSPKLGEFGASRIVLQALPQPLNLHLGNSMPVRYANFIGLTNQQKGIRVFVNRGTSGIEGVNSTAVGAALGTDQLVVLLTGDLSFFYDRNAFWHNYRLPHLRIILLNNHAGGIFRIIDGPSKQPELEAYFETRQNLTAYNTARDFNFEYFHCSDQFQLNSILDVFFASDGKTKLLEIESESKYNKEVFDHFKSLINKTYGT
ncbi:MAG: 2-succinyl-5-enolpyruvyl-6-hydroxy-3-cyclohexene-1-carboxylic-acid synthase [Candidatus Cyclobacteriaceae bacterium M3_2C_046]